ncbi:hypothetical protein [Yinghuangia aomiensis]|uniref:hypothetical protein n=1 Tax=Yinghuangia aomiensis TaxID=676205 RepID=UPI0031F18830
MHIRDQHAIGQIGEFALRGVAGCNGGFKEGENLLLELRCTVSVLSQQPRTMRPFRVLRVHPRHRVGVAGLHRRFACGLVLGCTSNELRSEHIIHLGIQTDRPFGVLPAHGRLGMPS